jgi:hypothetical protein
VPAVLHRGAGRDLGPAWRVADILLMWRLRLAYYLGAKPDRLPLAYGRIPPSPAQSSAGP